MKLGKPIILVTFNYRLNIFSFGDGNGMKNLALRDQRLALDWIRKHIATFGGNPVSAEIPMIVRTVYSRIYKVTYHRCRRERWSSLRPRPLRH